MSILNDLELENEINCVIDNIDNQINILNKQKELLKTISLPDTKIDELLWHKICETSLKNNEEALTLILHKVFPDAKEGNNCGTFFHFYLNGLHCGISTDSKYEIVIFKTYASNLESLLSRHCNNRMITNQIIDNLYKTADRLNTFRNGVLPDNVKLILHETIVEEKDWKDYFKKNNLEIDGLDFDYKKIVYCVGDKLYYNLNEFDSPAHSIPVTVTEVNENNIVCKDSTGTSYMFDEDMLNCVTNNPMY